MASDLEVAEHFDQMNKVVAEVLKGNNPTTISKTLGIKRTEVLDHLETWRGLMKSDNNIRERAKEALGAADQHYAMIINRAWETVEQADAGTELRTKAQALKLIADVEARRIEMLQKAGLLETERKQEILMGILRDVTSSCDHCKFEVARRLSEASGRLEAVDIND
jgi:uncharacterized Zn finger protein